jgi:protein-S-isoprenylcysteine O-methyltransferase Ste14
VNRRELQRSMYELQDPSVAQRLTLAAIAAVWVAAAWWLLFGKGIEAVGGRFGWNWRSGDLIRRACLACALTIYYVRILFTEFVFLIRGVSWSEVFTIAPWMLCIYLLLAIAGGTNASPLGAPGGIGMLLFIVGSWMNTHSEYARHAWKQKPENRGHLYTEGLFRYSRHPNYLGDLISFSGLSLVSGAWVTAAIPALMLAGFVFFNIPALDSHLHDRYGAAFDDYAKRTRKLIPFVY